MLSRKADNDILQLPQVKEPKSYPSTHFFLKDLCDVFCGHLCLLNFTYNIYIFLNFVNRKIQHLLNFFVVFSTPNWPAWFSLSL